MEGFKPIPNPNLLVPYTPKSNLLDPRICEQCGKEFVRGTAIQRFCGSLKRRTGCSYARTRKLPLEYLEKRARIRRKIGTRLKIRFEVFKKHNFTCVYCGRKPPDVELELEHIFPVSRGGTSEMENLTCSCQQCNRGKVNILLSEKMV